MNIFPFCVSGIILFGWAFFDYHFIWVSVCEALPHSCLDCSRIVFTAILLSQFPLFLNIEVISRTLLKKLR